MKADLEFVIAAPFVGKTAGERCKARWCRTQPVQLIISFGKYDQMFTLFIIQQVVKYVSYYPPYRLYVIGYITL